MSRVTAVVGMAVALCGCGGGALGAGPMLLEVSSGVAPHFTWGMSGGYATGLRVSDSEQPQLMWRLRTAPEAASGFQSDVQYGVLPEGGEVVVPARTLSQGRRYRLAVDFLSGGTETLEFVP